MGLYLMIWENIQAAALEYGLDGMDLDVEDSGAGEDVQVDDDVLAVDEDEDEDEDENDDEEEVEEIQQSPHFILDFRMKMMILMIVKSIFHFGT